MLVHSWLKDGVESFCLKASSVLPRLLDCPGEGGVDDTGNKDPEG